MDLLAIFGVGTNLMFSLGIIFVIVITLFYVRQRLSDYDNKMSSMLQVVNGINNELNNIKGNISNFKSQFEKLETIHEGIEEMDIDDEILEENELLDDMGKIHEIDEEDDEHEDEDDDDKEEGEEYEV